MPGRSRFLALGLVVGLGLTPGFAGAGDALQVTNARVPASDEMGVDLPLLMTIRNDVAEADALQRRELFADRRHSSEEVDRLVDGHVEHVGDRFALELHL